MEGRGSEEGGGREGSFGKKGMERGHNKGRAGGERGKRGKREVKWERAEGERGYYRRRGR